VEVIDRLAERCCRVNRRHRPSPPAPWEFALAQGGRLTFEPGAQVEHSTAVRASAAEALSDVAGVEAILQEGFGERHAALAAVGIDLWHDLRTVPQQLELGRYISQAAYYDKRGPWGATMMRHTASLQLNLDLGPEGVWQERWLLANLASPLITATFACSPGPEAVCTRARVWQQLDPTRTGFPSLLVSGAEDDPRLQYADAALAADVMLFRLANDVYETGEPGFSFNDWIRDGHPQHGWPTIDDFDYHLTTLFFEIRPRGFFELRAGEALPYAWRAAPVVLVTSLLYDDRARTQALAELDGCRERLPEMWLRAAVDGLRDDRLAALAESVWRLALDGVARMPDGYFGSSAVATTRSFVDRFVLHGRMPADDLGELIEEDPGQALAWATSGWSDPRLAKRSACCP
jgi:glutamate--cysteine ligase